MRLSLLLLASILSAGLSSASASTQAFAYCAGLGTHDLQTNYATCSGSQSYNLGNGMYFGRSETVFSKALYGVLGASGIGAVSGNVDGAATSTEADSSFIDPFTLTTASPTTGTITFNFLVTGNQGHGGSGNFGTDGVPWFTYTFFYGEAGNGYTSMEFIPNGTTPLNFVMTFSTLTGPYSSDFQSLLETDGLCQITGVGSCNVWNLFYDTAVVTGFQILDSNGNPLPASDLAFQSGTNYNDLHETPEPGSIVMVGTAVLGLLPLIKRSIARHRS